MDVYQNADNYCPGFTSVILDDEDAIRYLEWFDHAYQFKGTSMVLSTAERFRTLRLGAHKADLLRYTLLFHFGGLYLDIKTRFRVPFTSAGKFDDMSSPFLYTCIGAKNHWRKKYINYTHNGVIGCTPGHPILAECIHLCLTLPDWILNRHYLSFCHFLGVAIADRYFDGGYLQPGVTSDNSLQLLAETVSDTDFSECGGKSDHYGFCAVIRDGITGKVAYLGRDPEYGANGYGT